MVSIGLSRASCAEIKAPSPRTTIKGARIPSAVNLKLARSIKPSIIPIKRAFNTDVSARFGPFNFEDS